MALDHVGIALLDERRQSLERRSLRFLYVHLIDDDEFLPAGVVRKRDAHECFVERKNLELQEAEFVEGQTFEKRRSLMDEVVLDRITQGEKPAPRILQTVPERD